jgi:hypothetical protein
MFCILTVVVTLIILVWQLLVANHKVRLASFTSMESRQQTQACRLSPSFFFHPRPSSYFLSSSFQLRTQQPTFFSRSTSPHTRLIPSSLDSSCTVYFESSTLVQSISFHQQTHSQSRLEVFKMRSNVVSAIAGALGLAAIADSAPAAQ